MNFIYYWTVKYETQSSQRRHKEHRER